MWFVSIDTVCAVNGPENDCPEATTEEEAIEVAKQYFIKLYGGMVQDVFSNEGDVRIIIVDWDQEEATKEDKDDFLFEIEGKFFPTLAANERAGGIVKVSPTHIGVRICFCYSLFTDVAEEMGSAFAIDLDNDRHFTPYGLGGIKFIVPTLGTYFLPGFSQNWSRHLESFPNIVFLQG